MLQVSGGRATQYLLNLPLRDDFQKSSMGGGGGSKGVFGTFYENSSVLVASPVPYALCIAHTGRFFAT